MNPGLSTVDIGRFVVDEQSFLGQTLKLGVDYGLLPENAHEALRMYLQTRTMMFGQRNRSGIAVGREEVEQGLFQTTVCLDVGLIDRSGGDANRAAELLAQGDFEDVRKRGWELAYFRLEEMHQEATLFPQRREAAFLQDYAEDVRRWSHTAPETWICEDPEDEDGPTIADPAKSYLTYQDLMLRVGLLKVLPSDALKRFGAASGGPGPFVDLLRNLIVSLSLRLERLVLDPSEVATFSQQRFGTEVEALVEQIAGQIGPDVDAGARDRFLGQVREETREMSGIDDDLLMEQLITQVC